MSKIGIGCVFPIWKIDSDIIAGKFIEAGFKDIIVCVDTKVFDGGFAGREFDGDLLTDLPP